MELLGCSRTALPGEPHVVQIPESRPDDTLVCPVDEVRWVSGWKRKQAGRVARGLLRHRFNRNSACRGETRDGQSDPCRLVTLSAVWHWREVRRIRFGEKSLIRDELEKRVIAPFVERDDAAERDVP